MFQTGHALRNVLYFKILTKLPAFHIFRIPESLQTNTYQFTSRLFFDGVVFISGFQISHRPTQIWLSDSSRRAIWGPERLRWQHGKSEQHIQIPGTCQHSQVHHRFRKVQKARRNLRPLRIVKGKLFASTSDVGCSDEKLFPKSETSEVG